MERSSRIILKLKALFFLQLVYFLVRVCSLYKVLHLLIPVDTEIKRSSYLPKDLIDAVESASWRFRWLRTCLPRSIVLCRLLRQSGIVAEVRIGVQSAGKDAIRAHAWVEDNEGNTYDLSGIELESYQQLEEDFEPKPDSFES